MIDMVMHVYTDAWKSIIVEELIAMTNNSTANKCKVCGINDITRQPQTNPTKGGNVLKTATVRLRKNMHKM